MCCIWQVYRGRRFYNCSSIFMDLGLKNVSYKRLAHDMNYSHQVVCGTFGCDVLLSLLCFRVLCGKNRKCIHTSYDDFRSICPMTWLQNTYNSSFFFSQWHIWHFYICDLLLYLTFSKYLKGMLKNWKAPSFSFCVTNALHVLSRRPLGCWQALK